MDAQAEAMRGAFEFSPFVIDLICWMVLAKLATGFVPHVAALQRFTAERTERLEASVFFGVWIIGVVLF